MEITIFHTGVILGFFRIRAPQNFGSMVAGCYIVGAYRHDEFEKNLFLPVTPADVSMYATGGSWGV